jgi:hypothetical protein
MTVALSGIGTVVPIVVKNWTPIIVIPYLVIVVALIITIVAVVRSIAVIDTKEDLRQKEETKQIITDTVNATIKALGEQNLLKPAEHRRGDRRF